MSWQDILKAAVPIGQMQYDTEQNLSVIVDKLIDTTKYTDRLNRKLAKEIRNNPSASSYVVQSPLRNRILQTVQFRGQPTKIIDMLQQRLAQDYGARSVTIQDKTIRFNEIDKSRVQENEEGGQ